MIEVNETSDALIDTGRGPKWIHFNRLKRAEKPRKPELISGAVEVLKPSAPVPKKRTIVRPPVSKPRTIIIDDSEDDESVEEASKPLSVETRSGRISKPVHRYGVDAIENKEVSGDECKSLGI